MKMSSIAGDVQRLTLFQAKGFEIKPILLPKVQPNFIPLLTTLVYYCKKL